MATPVMMPQMGESVIEGTVARWLKAPGDSVEKLEPLLEISTDKIDTEVPAPAGGTLLTILAQEGVTVAAGSVLAYIGAEGEEAPVAPEPEEADAPSPPGDEAPLEEAGASRAEAQAKPAGRTFISPVVARMAAEHAVNLDRIQGSGLGGRITKKDVQAFLNGQPDEPPAPNRSAPSQPRQRTPLTGDTVIEPLTTMRRAIADHMVLSKRTSPHVTTVMEADMTAVVRHREANRSALAQRGIALTYSAYFVAAAAAALRAVPIVNSSFREEGIARHTRINIGVAAAIPAGLIVPVLRDADELSLPGIARTLEELVARARSGRLQPDELQNGTFTITNHGIGGSLLGTPIINQPQSAILGVGAIVKRPIVVSESASLLPSADDAIVIRPMCYLSLTIDHRVLDGAAADEFLSVVKKTLEGWS
ncbi:MAG: 2-oxo acid dehydrogenase subunit E2 [Caldilineaceae bacterium]|nr:2-oxo acid dehydrogenase subunit E2 [Caldilineaceae bacterium]